MIKGLYVSHANVFETVYGPEEQLDISKFVDIYAAPQTAKSIQQNPSVLSEAEILFGSWGMPELNGELLKSAPKLKAIFYGAGSVKGFVTEAFWDRNIVLSSAYAANAVPVSEYVLSQILFCLKHGWQNAFSVKKEKKFQRREKIPGAFQSTVGIISLGMIGRLVRERLRPFDLKVIAYDPFLSREMASELNVELCSLEELFRRADVVSLHTPWLPETVGLITGSLIKSMKPGATFINTARGAVVNEPELISVLAERQDLFAVLDVTWPEPPPEDSLLYTLPNVVLTPHIAGSLDMECRRMGRYMVDELKRYLASESLRWSITKEKALLLA